MLLFTVFLITWISINEVYSVMPVDLPFYAEEGNWVIKAKLTEKDSAKQIKIDEYIKSVNGSVTGKIVVQIDNNSPASIYYKNENPYERLHVKGAKCTHLLYQKGHWDHSISDMGIENFSSNLILVGPSILFRINKHNPVWESGKDDVIRGVKHHSATASLDSLLETWFYYKGNSLEGLKSPTRILFSRYLFNNKNVKTVEQYWFDYYITSRVEQNFDTIVTPEPGIFCDKYFEATSTQANKPLPKFNQHVLHFISKTKSFKAGPDKKEEVYANDKYQMLRIQSSTTDKDNIITSKDAIYDYQLGIKYEFTENGNCSISPMDLSAPGIVADSSLNYGNYKLDLNRLLNLDLVYRYLGSVFFEDRDEVGLKAWEKYDKNFKFGGKKFPNAIITQYMRETADQSNGYTLVGTTMKAHDNSKKLTASLAISYFDFGHEMSPLGNMEKFSVKDCYSDPRNKKTVVFYFTCPDNRCERFNQYYHQIQDKIEEALINTRTISASRISDIIPIIDSKEIIIYVTILDFPNIKNAFQVKNMKLAQKVLTSASTIDGDEEACLRLNAYKYEPFASIAFCRNEDANVCQKIDNKKVKLVEDKNNGTSCLVFMTPLKNVYRYSQESSLNNIHEKLTHIEITLISPDNNENFKLNAYQISDVTKPAEEYNSAYEMLIQNTKLIDDKLETIQVFDAIDLSSCHQKCVHSVENDCSSFSFCTYPDKVECFLSTVSNVSSERISKDSACGTYFINNLVKFKKISLKKFTNIETSVPFESPLGKCATLCSDTDSCKSFQYCSGSCSLAGYFTDASSVYSKSCDIYIPNVLHRFELTGKSIVKEMFHTEINLNAEQCAALCHDWKDGDVVCQSFNFCSAHGKAVSLCHLSKYSTHDGNVERGHFDNCQSYKRIKQTENEQQNTRASTKLQPFGTFYWLIALFVATGLVSGIIVSVAYSKIIVSKSNASDNLNRHTFSWTKQLNDERQSIANMQELQMPSVYPVSASE